MPSNKILSLLKENVQSFCKSFWVALEPDLLVLLIDRGPSISVELYGLVRRGWLQIWRTGLLLNLGRYVGDLWPVEAGM